MSLPLRSVIVTVGDELLHGETIDTNAAWLGRRLGALGIPVVRSFTVGDDPSEIRRALSRALEGSDLVVLSGGLGPTKDDLTKPTVADFLGLPLDLEPDLLAALEARFLSRGLARLPEPNVGQARVPRGAAVLANPLGTAPGLALESVGAMIVLLPGVPRELRGIFEGDLEVLLRERFGDRLQPVHHRVIHTTGVPESRLAELVEEVRPQEMGPVSLAFLPDLRGVDLRLTARGVPEGEASRWLDAVERAVAPAVAAYRFDAESGDLAEALVEELRRTGRKLAVAESCTGGLIAKRITDRPGVSRVFVGGVVAYANLVKVRLLAVSEEDLATAGAVSETVVRQMVEGVCRSMGADAGIAVTGVAGPGGGTPEKPVGTVWLAAQLDLRVVSRLSHYVGERDAIRERAAQDALALLYELVRDRATEA